MTRAERELRELELTLYCTGKFSDRREARKAAKAQIERERLKRIEANSTTQTPLAETPGVFTLVQTAYSARRHHALS